jgi:hypothetical protein
LTIDSILHSTPTFTAQISQLYLQVWSYLSAAPKLISNFGSMTIRDINLVDDALSKLVLLFGNAQWRVWLEAGIGSSESLKLQPQLSVASHSSRYNHHLVQVTNE